MRRWLATLACAWLAVGCSEGEEEERVRFSLLHRHPDTILDQPGEVRPSSEEAWQEFGVLGWQRTPRQAGTPKSHIWSTLPRSLVRLPAGPPVDRTLRVELRDGAGPEAIPLYVELELNGVALGEHSVASEPTTLELPVPSALWVRGENLLALSVNRMHEGQWGPRGLALVRVQYDTPSRVELDTKAGQLVLASQTGVRYAVETPSEARLRVEGRSAGSGQIEIAVHRMDPATGALTFDPDPLRHAVKDGPLELERALPLADSTVRVVDITWLATRPDVKLELQRVEVDEDEAPERPPILFLSVDTLAARSMSLYGYGRSTSPQLERWASEEAVDFRKCKANAPWTVPSYLSQMTGLYPHANRVPMADLQESRGVAGHSLAIWELYQLAPNRWTLAELLRSAGYRTAAIIDNTWLGRIPGFSQGFDSYDDEPSRIAIEDTDGGMRMIFPRALDWLADRSEDEPFFLFLQILDCHGPYLPIKPWRGSFDKDDGLRDRTHVAPTIDYSSPPTFGTIPEYIAHSLVDPNLPLPGRMTTAPLIQAYDEKVLEVDAVIGDFLERLKKLPFYDDAIIVISADHGESMTEHDHLFRHGAVYEETLHVPLIVKLPHGAFAGTRVDDTVQLVDLYPTLADYTAHSSRDDLHGRSLRPLLEGGTLDPRPAVSQGNIMDQTSIELEGWKLTRSEPEHASIRTLLTHREIAAEIPDDLFNSPEPFRVPAVLLESAEAQAFERENAVLVDAVKLFLRDEGVRYELYDLNSDPAESKNLAKLEPERVAALTRLLELADAQTNEARELASFSTKTISLDDESRAELIRLGYLDED